MPTKGGFMYRNFKKTYFLSLLMIFSALTYMNQAYSTDSGLIARDERFQGGGGERGESGERGGGDRNSQYQGAYHPSQGNYGGDQYRDQGRSYSSQSRAAGAYGAGAMRGYNQGENNNEGNVQYVPVNPYEQQPSSQPQQTYPYTQQPY